MLKSTLVAATAAIALLGVALPVYASTGSVFQGSTAEARQIDAARTLVLLRQSGIDAVSVSEWGGYLRADVRQSDGHTVMRLFQPVTFEPVAFDTVTR